MVRSVGGMGVRLFCGYGNGLLRCCRRFFDESPAVRSLDTSAARRDIRDKMNPKTEWSAVVYLSSTPYDERGAHLIRLTFPRLAVHTPISKREDARILASHAAAMTETTSGHSSGELLGRASYTLQLPTRRPMPKPAEPLTSKTLPDKAGGFNSQCRGARVTELPNL